MSRNDRSGTLVATVSSVTIGLVITLSLSVLKTTPKQLAVKLSPVLNPVIEPISKGSKEIKSWVVLAKKETDDLEEAWKRFFSSLRTDKNNRNSLPFIAECRHKKNDEEVGIFQACKDIYDGSLSAVKDEMYKTNNQASQDRLEQVSRKAAKKKQQELLASGISIATGTTTLIASAAVADSDK